MKLKRVLWETHRLQAQYMGGYLALRELEDRLTGKDDDDDDPPAEVVPAPPEPPARKHRNPADRNVTPAELNGHASGPTPATQTE